MDIDHVEVWVRRKGARDQVLPVGAKTIKALDRSLELQGGSTRAVSRGHQWAHDIGHTWAVLLAVYGHVPMALEEVPARTAGVRSLGVEETASTHAGPRRRTRFVTGLS